MRKVTRNPVQNAEAAQGGARILDLLGSYRFCYTNERQLQDVIELALSEGGVEFEREAELGGEFGRIDFLTSDRVGIEIKIKGSPSSVARQLIRYAESPKIDVLLLVTGRSLLGRLPEKLLEKPLLVFGLWEAFL